MINSVSSAIPSNDSNPEYQREELHLRRIEMRGFKRSDGLFEVEGWVTDQKPTDFDLPTPGKTVAAMDFIHRMGVRLVFDEGMVVRQVYTLTVNAPYENCVGGGQALQSLVGERMVSGWSNTVRTHLRGAASCTHLMELLIPMATTAHQSMVKLRLTQPDPVDANGRPVQIDSCYGYAADGPVVMHRWPQFHQS